MSGEFTATNPIMISYVKKLKELFENLKELELKQLPRVENSHADALINSIKPKTKYPNRIFVREKYHHRCLNVNCGRRTKIYWIDPIKDYIAEGILQDNQKLR